MTKTKNNFLQTFLVLAAVVWSGSWWLWRGFHKVVHLPGYSQAKFMGDFAKISLIFVLIYILTQIILLKKRGSKWLLVAGKVGISLMGLCLVAFLVSRILGPEGLDLVFCFILALISGFLTYSKVAKFDIKGFLTAFLAWVLIISMNELIQCFLPMRKGNIGDFGSNMAGVLIGLLLISRWLWRK